MFKLSENATRIIRLLEQGGFEAYAVGGCVRDMLMGKSASDTDITTNAHVEEIKAVFVDYRTIDTGIKHGTVTVLIENESFEITTYRTESTYSDNRHPDKVVFTKSLTQDLARRDFTMNSIAYNPLCGFVDPFGGKSDIENKIIRCVGNAKARFEEDSLRILRGLRFSAVLGFSIDEETKKAMLDCRHLIKNISRERVFAELSKLICGEGAGRILREFPEIFAEFIPEIGLMKGFLQHNFHHIHDVLAHTAAVVDSSPPVLHLRLAALFHDIAKPLCFSLDENGVGHFYAHANKGVEIAGKRLAELRCDNKTRDAVLKLIKLHDTPIEESEKIIKRRLASMGSELFFDLIRLKRADTMGLAPEFHSRMEHFDHLEEMARKIITDSECFSLKDLAVKGNDLVALGFEGREIGEALNLLLEAVIDGKVRNEKEALIEYIKKEL